MDTLRTVTFALRNWSDGPKHVLIDPDIYTPDVSHLLMDSMRATQIKEYQVMASYGRAMEWVKYFPSSIGCIVVISNRNIADDMQLIRPDLDIRKIQTKTEIKTNE